MLILIELVVLVSYTLSISLTSLASDAATSMVCELDPPTIVMELYYLAATTTAALDCIVLLSDSILIRIYTQMDRTIRMQKT